MLKVWSGDNEGLFRRHYTVQVKENSDVQLKPNVTVKRKLSFNAGNSGPIITRSGRVVNKPKRFPE